MVTMERSVVRKLPDGSSKRVEPYHVCLKGLETAVLCRDDEDYDYDPEDDTLYECVCPTCGETIVMDDKMVESGSIECPNCGESLEFDFSDDETEE